MPSLAALYAKSSWRSPASLRFIAGIFPTVAARRILSNDPSKEQSSLVIRQIADAEAERQRDVVRARHADTVDALQAAFAAARSTPVGGRAQC